MVNIDWTEIKISVPIDSIDKVGGIANMTVPYGIYIEDYSNLEAEAMEIAHIDLIDEELLARDRTIGIVHIYISNEDNPQEAIQYLKERLAAEKIDFKIEQSICRNEDWENNWKAYFKPMPIGKKLLIRPAWVDEYEANGRSVLNIEPGAAFGTGTHETTRLCLEVIEAYVTPDSQVLDIGCGSGILSVAALLLGAKNATGVDIDKIAVKTAIENALMNGYKEPIFTALYGNLTDKINSKYDIVLANIVADAIIELSKNVRQFMKPNAVYIVSGIIDTRETEVTDALKNSGFTIIKRHEENGWLCFECK